MKLSLLDGIGKTRGHFKFKENRAAKLISVWDQLTEKMERMVERGYGESLTARLAYGTLTMMETGIRVGNETSAEGWVCENQMVRGGKVVYQHELFGQHVQTFGLTTLLNKHVIKKRKKFLLDFTGKKLVRQTLEVRHPVLVEYKPDGADEDRWLNITYPDLRRFISKYVGGAYTPKDLRIAKVNLLFVNRFVALADRWAEEDTKSGRKAVLRECVEDVAATIGHTVGVCKSAYLSRPLQDLIRDAEPGTVFKL